MQSGLKDKSHIGSGPHEVKMDRDWIKIENFLTRDIADLLYGYVLLADRRLRVLKENDINSSLPHLGNIYGTIGDSQSDCNFACYGDLIFDTILLGKVSELQSAIGLGLIPQYTYYRLYSNGSELKKHNDRPSCEISGTMCLGYESHYNWPIFFTDKNGQDISVELNPGDLVLYKGCDLEHWREPFEGTNHAQVFLHYTNKDGQYNDYKFDHRIGLGVATQ